MKNAEMTELQRQSLEHFEQARREGLSVKAYSRAHGISAQQIYDTVGWLRRRGALPDQAATSGKFIAVKIAPTSSSNATVCRMVAPGGLVIECLQWPPRAWLESLTRTPDAAT
jgi:transposase-like protein